MINILSAKNFTTCEICTLNKAHQLTERVLDDEAFRAEVGAIPLFPDPSGPTAGSEVLAALEKPVSVNLTIQSYPWWNVGKRGEVAHENSSGVTFNRRFWNPNDLPAIVDTLIHEMLHQLGFSHDYERTARRDDQSPYRVGRIAEKHAARLLATVAEPVVEPV